jgi:hypothetical protein
MRIRTHDKGRGHLRELLVDGETASRLTVLDHQMRIGSAQVRMGGIGGVHTKEKHRMKGYMRQLMDDTVEYLKNEGYDVTVLFGLPDFYTKFDYAACLPSHRLLVSTIDAEEAQNDMGDYEIRKIEKGDIDSVRELYNQNNRSRTCSIVRTKESFSGFGRIPIDGGSTDNFLVEDNNKQLLAYAVFQKSQKRVGTFVLGEHLAAGGGDALIGAGFEIESGEDKVFPTILYEFARMAIERRCGHVAFFMPPDHPFANFCHRYGCGLTTQYPKNEGGMMRIINQRTLFEKIEGELGRRISDSQLRNYSGSLQIRTEIGSTAFRFRNGFLSIHSGQKADNFLILPQSKLIQLIVGYRTARDILNDSDVEASGTIESLLDTLFPETIPYIGLPDRF